MVIQTCRWSKHLTIGSRRLLRCLLCIPLALACLPVAAKADGDPWPSRPIDSPLTCPEALVLQPVGNGDYFFVAGAKEHVTASLDAILYTSKGSYEFTLPSIGIDQPSRARVGTFTSPAVVIHAQPGEPYLGISLSSVGTSCGASRIMALRVSAASQDAHGRLDSFIASVLKDAIPPGGAIEPEQMAGSKPPPCAEPFAQVRTNVINVPPYPSLAREEGAVGITHVEVRLDASGKVTQSEVRKSSGNSALDAAAERAARATTYFPAVFDCRPDSGEYTFQAQFTGR